MPALNKEEIAPLTEDDKLDASKKATLCQNVDWPKCGGLSALVLFLFYFFFSGSGPKPQHEIHQAVTHSNQGTSSLRPTVDDRPLPPVKGDRLAIFQPAKKALEERLRIDYGSSYDSIFYDENSELRRVFQSGNKESTLSWERLRRKLSIKLLQNNGQSHFVWVTGGHSATAGHGNFYDESYTSYLEKAAKPVFESVGVRFTGKNYAMGGTGAAPEVAFCVKEIFGQDVDALVWDYGMTDGNELWKQNLYHHRAGLLKSRPINFIYHAGGRSEKGRIQIADEIEKMGLAALISSEKVMSDAIDAVPDSFGKSEAEIQNMPAFVKNFRCDKQIENGDPYCKIDKYNETACSDRKFKTSWHPGFKWHALMGNLAALYLLDALESAVKEVSQSSDPRSFLKQLQAAEDKDFEQYFAAPLPDMFSSVLEDGMGIDLKTFFKGPMYCHTARLPAEIRHRGILTETAQTGFTTFFQGTELKDALSKPLSSDMMPLVYNKADRQPCPIPTNMDYKDFFFVSSKDSWRKLVLPNNAELKEYSSGAPLQGIVSVCFALCPWGKCPPGVLQPDDFHAHQFEFRINDVPVSNFTTFKECTLLRHSGGYQFPVSDGRMHIEARVTEVAKPSSYLRMSAFLVW